MLTLWVSNDLINSSIVWLNKLTSSNFRLTSPSWWWTQREESFHLRRGYRGCDSRVSTPSMLPLSLTPSLPLSHSLSFSFSLSLSHILSYTHPFTHTFSLFLTLVLPFCVVVKKVSEVFWEKSKEPLGRWNSLGMTICGTEVWYDTGLH